MSLKKYQTARSFFLSHTGKHNEQKQRDDAAKSAANIQDHFHVYLNKFEFHVLWLHIDKTNKFCFFMHNGRVFGIAK